MPSKSRFCSLARRADFLDLKATGQVFHVNFWLLVNVRRTEREQFRCGFTLSRHIGTAVVRNRLKRWGKTYLRGWSKANAVSLDLNLIFKRREREFYQTLSHRDFDGVMDKMVARIGRVRD